MMVERILSRGTLCSCCVISDNEIRRKGEFLSTVEFLQAEKHEMSGFVTLGGLRLGWRAWKDLVGKWYVHAPYCPDVPSQEPEKMSQGYQDFFRDYWSDLSQRSQFGAGIILICTEKEKELGW